MLPSSAGPLTLGAGPGDDQASHRQGVQLGEWWCSRRPSELSREWSFTQKPKHSFPADHRRSLLPRVALTLPIFTLSSCSVSTPARGGVKCTSWPLLGLWVVARALEGRAHGEAALFLLHSKQNPLCWCAGASGNSPQMLCGWFPLPGRKQDNRLVAGAS